MVVLKGLQDGNTKKARKRHHTHFEEMGHLLLRSYRFTIIGLSKIELRTIDKVSRATCEKLNKTSSNICQ